MVKLHSREGLGAGLWSFPQRNNLGEGWERKCFLLQDRDDIQQFYFFHCPHDFIIKAVKSSQGLWIQIYCVVCNRNFKGYLILNYVIEHDRRDIAWSFLKMPRRAIDWSCPAQQTKCYENNVLSVDRSETCNSHTYSILQEQIRSFSPKDCFTFSFDMLWGTMQLHEQYLWLSTALYATSLAQV